MKTLVTRASHHYPDNRHTPKKPDISHHVQTPRFHYRNHLNKSFQRCNVIYRMPKNEHRKQTHMPFKQKRKKKKIYVNPFEKRGETSHALKITHFLYALLSSQPTKSSTTTKNKR